MDKITYLLGAGASANSLPIVSGIPEYLGREIGKLNNEEFQLGTEHFPNFSGSLSKREYQQKLIDGFIWLKNETENHSSIDTFAKKLFLKGKTVEYRKLKTLLSIFFGLIQNPKTIDTRYDSFLASIIDSLANFPNHIKILSWNYDAQFELALLGFLDDYNLDSLNSKINIYDQAKSDINKNSGFSISNLNGTASYFTENDGGYQILKNWTLVEDETELSLDLMEKIVFLYAKSMMKKHHPVLNFSWDNEKTVNTAINEVVDTNILVVIGYSFPFFNREIDRKIISSMPSLSKVYFQSPEADNLKERFSSINSTIPKDNLICISGTKQFYLPNEL